MQAASTKIRRRPRAWPWLVAAAALALAANNGCEAGESAETGEESNALSAAPATYEVAVPEALRALALAPGPESATALVLRIEGVRVPPERAAVVRVFANLPEASAETATDSDHYLGYFTVVPSTLGPEAVSEPRDIQLDVTSTLPGVLAESPGLRVTLVPIAGEAGTERPETFELEFSKIYLSREN